MNREKTNRSENPVAIITGGAQGIGYAIAKRLRRDGILPYLWDLDGELAKEAAAALEGAEGMQVDVCDAAAVWKMRRDLDSPRTIL